LANNNNNNKKKKKLPEETTPGDFFSGLMLRLRIKTKWVDIQDMNDKPLK